MEMTNWKCVVGPLPFAIDGAYVSIKAALGYLETVRGMSSSVERCLYHLESAIYQLEHPINEAQAKTTDATSV